MDRKLTNAKSVVAAAALLATSYFAGTAVGENWLLKRELAGQKSAGQAAKGELKAKDNALKVVVGEMIHAGRADPKLRARWISMGLLKPWHFSTPKRVGSALVAKRE